MKKDRTLALVNIVITYNELGFNRWFKFGSDGIAQEIYKVKEYLCCFPTVCLYVLYSVNHAFAIEIRAKIVHHWPILQFDLRMLLFPSNKTAGIYGLFRPYYFYTLILCCVHILYIHIFPCVRCV
jgi:hypothetical protein